MDDGSLNDTVFQVNANDFFFFPITLSLLPSFFIGKLNIQMKRTSDDEKIFFFFFISKEMKTFHDDGTH